jgi:hypothetical protein
MKILKINTQAAGGSLGILVQEPSDPTTGYLEFRMQGVELQVWISGVGGKELGARAVELVRSGLNAYLNRGAMSESEREEMTLPYDLRRDRSLLTNILVNALAVVHSDLVKHNSKVKDSRERLAAEVLLLGREGLRLSAVQVGSFSLWLYRGGRRVECLPPQTLARDQDPLSLDSQPGMSLPLQALGLGDQVFPDVREMSVRPHDGYWVQNSTIFEDLRLALGMILENSSDGGLGSSVRMEIEECLSRHRTEGTPFGYLGFVGGVDDNNLTQSTNVGENYG